MKNFFYCLSCAFSLLGGIVGAGFITGSELIVFFGTDNFYLPLTLSCALLFFGFYISLTLAENSGGLKHGLKKITPMSGVYETFILLSSFFVLSAMIASLDALSENIGISYPIFSVSSLFAALFLAPLKTEGIRKINLILVPVSIIVVVFLILYNGDLRFEKPLFTADFKSLFLSAPIYAFMNVFNSLPLTFSLGRSLGGKQRVFVSGLTAAISALFAALILAFLKGSRGAINSAIPMGAAAGSGIFAVLFFVATFFAIFTSVIISYYPIYTAFDGKGKARYSPVVLLFAFVFSRLGLNVIVKYAYALIGGIGGLFLINAATFLLRNKKGKKYKKTFFENNTY